MGRSSSFSHRATPLAVSASVAAGLFGADVARAQAPSDAAVWMRRRAESMMASRRDYRELEANGFRYVGTDGHAPYVYYVYRRGDGLEYHCAQGAWKTGPCFPNRARDPRVLPRHVRIVDLQRAGYAYQGLVQSERGLEHLYRHPQTGKVYACANEGHAGCRTSDRGPARRTAVRSRSTLD